MPAAAASGDPFRLSRQRQRHGMRTSAQDEDAGCQLVIMRKYEFRLDSGTYLHLTPTTTLALDPNLIPELDRSFLQLIRRDDLIHDTLLEQLGRSESVPEKCFSKNVG